MTEYDFRFAIPASTTSETPVLQVRDRTAGGFSPAIWGPWQRVRMEVDETLNNHRFLVNIICNLQNFQTPSTKEGSA